MPLAVVAIGGNALQRAEETGAIEQQFINARYACDKFSALVAEGWDLVITHGNGPQVGSLLWAVELAAQNVHPVDLGICDANTQGQIGYMLQQVLGNTLNVERIQRGVVTLVTQVEVAADDPAFENPSKPIGPFFLQDEAQEKMDKHGWIMKEDSGRGWRRLVPSPVPRQIIEIDAIRNAIRAGFVPIAGGGGGIPVIRREDGGHDGVEAVIDKDLTASLLARRLAADLLIVCTAVPHVLLNFGTPQEQALREIDAGTLQQYIDDGHFPKGSMGPKVEAALGFVSRGGVGTRRRAIITDMDNFLDSLRGTAGTVISP